MQCWHSHSLYERVLPCFCFHLHAHQPSRSGIEGMTWRLVSCKCSFLTQVPQTCAWCSLRGRLCRCPWAAHDLLRGHDAEIENYVHRIGRTGRCGKTGIATTFINKDQSESILLDLKHLLTEAKQRIPPVLTVRTCAQPLTASMPLAPCCCVLYNIAAPLPDA